MRLHATCVAFHDAGLLLLGVPGAGKSALALRLMERGWLLVADDQVDIIAVEGALEAAAPASGAGKLEIRGLGVFEGLPHAAARLALVARLRPASTIARLPEPSRWRAHGLDLPEFPLDAADVAAPEKAAWALRAALGTLRQSAGAFAP
jgi:HPr kinase/phosphorylase